jgi:hypothetical protein
MDKKVILYLCRFVMPKLHKRNLRPSPWDGFSRSCFFAWDLRRTEARPQQYQSVNSLPPPAHGRPKIRQTVSFVIFSSLPAPGCMVMSCGSNLCINHLMRDLLSKASVRKSNILENPNLATASRCRSLIIQVETITS